MASVLLIEDDKETANEISAELGDRGYAVDWAADGIEGLDKARSGKAEVIIVDRLLPGMDGLTIVEALRTEGMPYPPTIRKVNPADTPILVLGLTSDSLPLTTVDYFAENILLQKISQISGVGLVGIGGQQKPSIRVQVNPQALAVRGLSLEDVRTVLGQANVDLPKGTLNTPRQTYTLNTNDQLLAAEQYDNLVIGYRNGAPIRISDIGHAISAPENNLVAGWNNQKRAIILAIQRQPGANVIETVDRIKSMLPVLKASIPAAVNVSIISDRTETIRASVTDVQFTLLLTVALVVMRRRRPRAGRSRLSQARRCSSVTPSPE